MVIPPGTDIDAIASECMRKTAWPLWAIPAVVLVLLYLLDLFLPGDFARLKMIALSHAFVGLVGFALAKKGFLGPIPLPLGN